MGPLVGPIFVWLCGDQEGNLVQQNAPAFWTPEGRPEGVRIGLSRSESILPPLPKQKKPGPCGPAFLFSLSQGQDLVLRREQVHSQPQRRGSVAISGKSNRSAKRGGRNPAPATKQDMGPLVGPIFVWSGEDQERNLVQQNALAFWTPGGRPAGVRIGASRSESILPPLPKQKKPGPCGPAFLLLLSRDQELVLREKQVQPRRPDDRLHKEAGFEGPNRRIAEVRVDNCFDM